MQPGPYVLKTIEFVLDSDVFLILFARFTAQLKLYCELEMDHLDSFYEFSDFLLVDDHSHLSGPIAYSEASCVRNRRPFFEHEVAQEYY